MTDAAHAQGDAMQLVMLVREYGPDAIHALIDRWDDDTRRAVLVALAAAVDPDKTWSQLWGWLGPVERPAVTVPIGDVWAAIAAPTTSQHRKTAVDRLTAGGLSAAEIARRIGTTQRTVVRDRSNAA